VKRFTVCLSYGPVNDTVSVDADIYEMPPDGDDGTGHIKFYRTDKDPDDDEDSIVVVDPPVFGVVRAAVVWILDTTSQGGSDEAADA